DGVRSARAAVVERRCGPVARDHLRTHLGLRLRDILTFAGCLRRLPASETRGRGLTARPANRPRRRLRCTGPMTLRWRIALMLAGVALLVGLFVAITAYLTTASELRSGIDDTLRARAEEVNANDTGDGGRGGGHSDHTDG